MAADDTRSPDAANDQRVEELEEAICNVLDVVAYTPRDLAEQTLDGTLPYEETWHENATNVLALSDALIAMRDLAMVTHNGDPWYAKNAGIDVPAILEQARRALGEESVLEIKHWKEIAGE